MRDAATVNYHVKRAERQAFRFDVGGVVGNLVSPELVPTEISVRDFRDGSFNVDFDQDGITFENHVTEIRDFGGSSDWETSYNEELKALLEARVGAEDVIIFDHTVRIDDPNADRRPARNVHNDYSRSGAEQRLVDLVGEDLARDFRAGHYGFVNVWRPIEQPIKTSPLGFIRPRSMKVEDWMTIELIYPDRIGQILGVAANEHHEWFYMSRMTPDDVAIFNIYDNRGRPILAHSALDMNDSQNVQAPRKSIESRTLIRYK
ncbi:MAG: CmcJ/NvfI family oxidoreductase [Geminicoccaceae bacterium]